VDQADEVGQNVSMSAITFSAAPRAISDRVAGFDLLRGVCALGVAIYHSLSWTNTAQLYNWGTYGVYIFFALSGASMYVAYAERFERGFSLLRFIGLRFIRLAPLYFLALLLGILYSTHHGTFPRVKWMHAILNLGFVTGLGSPGITSEVTGGWSIGIEFVFYLLFPVLLAFTRSRAWLGVVAIAFVLQHLFVNSVFANGLSLGENWPTYTQFLSFVFYFAAGCAIGRCVRRGGLPGGLVSASVFVACLVAIAVTNGPTPEYALLGVWGMMLSITAVLTVAAAATLSFGALGHRISDALGRASYGTYILHPWVSLVVAGVGVKVGMDPASIAVLTGLGSLTVAVYVEKWLERPVQNWLKARLYSTHA
jgi:peptidoglycan/LPS O-acetylase OafA/YrhL